MMAFRHGFVLLIFLAGVILSIPFNRMIEAHSPTGWKAPAKERKMKNPTPNTPDSRRSGQELYEGKCASCHGMKGDGKGESGKGLKPPPSDFTDRHMMKEMTDGEMFWKITTGKPPMPPYGKELTEKERWDLVNYLSSFAKVK